MNRKTHRWLVPTLLAAAMAAPACAQTQDTPAAGTPGTTGTPGTSGSTGAGTTSQGQSPARADTRFMEQAAQNGLTEVQASQLALQKATSSDVKTFAQHMVDEHTKANEELKALAQSKGVQLPTEPSLMQKGQMKLLETADGADFDKRYADRVGVKAHEDTVKLFQKAATEAKDPDVKAFATKTLPNLQHHLQMAQSLDAKVGRSSTGQP